jgi:PPOX class probable F420-dependent enzyme
VSALNRFYDVIRHRRASSAADGAPADGPLPDARYVLVVSYRRSGEGVPTPVWAARDGERLVFRTEADTAKVRRIGNDPRVRVAPCTVRGRPTGPAVDARARVLGPRDEAAERALAAKYGARRRVYTRVAPLGDLVYVEVVRRSSSSRASSPSRIRSNP